MKTYSPLRRSVHLLLASSLALLAPAPVFGHEDEKKPTHQHEHADHAGHDHSETSLDSVPNAWSAVVNAADQIDSAVAAKNLAPVHESEEALSAALKYLQSNSPMVMGDKAKRLDAALRQAIILSGNVHEAGDAEDVAKVEAEMKKLRAALKLVEAQYSTGTLDAGNNSKAAVTYMCPMKCVASEKPGKCAVCGMDMAPVSAKSAGPSMKAELAPEKPLKTGEDVSVKLKLMRPDGTPVLMDDLKTAHTRKIHLLIIDGSLTDYHHEHPEPTSKPGEYVFSFTPRLPGPYRVWADLVSASTGTQEYIVADIPAADKSLPVTNRAPSLSATVDGLTYTVVFDTPALKAGKAAMGKLTIKDGTGKIINYLEPVMGAYAHIVGFSEDFQSIAHLHPMGAEPTAETDRGQGELEFHLQPEKAGLLRLFAQVQIGGQDKFAPFTLDIQP